MRAEARDPAAGRVAEMHHHTRRGIAASGAFGIAAVIAAFVDHSTGPWLPLHLFLVGALVMAISTVTQMLAVTWSSSPAPPRRIITQQRWLLAAGVIAVAIGREADAPAITGTGGVAIALSLVILVALLISIRRTVKTDRFIPAIDAYVLAVVAALTGIVLGVVMASSEYSDATLTAHLTFNVFAFVGVVIGATLPYFMATQMRMKMNPAATAGRIRGLTGVLWLAAMVAAIAAWSDRRAVAAVALVVHALAILAIGLVLPRPTRKQWDWGGPRLVQILAGIGWWVAMTVWTAVELWRTGPDGSVLLALAVGGFGQVLLASFAYLVPVVRSDGHEALTAGFRQSRSWTGVLLGNAAGVLALTGSYEALTVVVAVWAADAVARLAFPPEKTSGTPAAAVGLAGAVGSVPPPSVPLSFLGASAAGLFAFGVAIVFAADKIVISPIFPATLGTVHLGMLAFLTVGVLGALHQFGPVIGQRRLRSIVVARLSWIGLVLTAWLLPYGFAFGPAGLIPAAGLIGATTVTLIAWNLSGPLIGGATGLPVQGLRMSVTLLLVTVGFGVTYAFARQELWFDMLPRRVLAHAHFGLIGWLGLTYASVAEKLWPMFLLSHRPSDRPGRIAVYSLAAGAAVLPTGLLLDQPLVAWVGGGVIALGAMAHMVSLATWVRHRRRPLEVLHAFLIVSSAFFALALVLALLAATLSVSSKVRTRLVSAEVMALTAWLGLAIVGHVHKIVPFIGYQTMRNRGIATGPAGRPLLFSDLTSRRPAIASLVFGTTGAVSIIVGLLTTAEPLVVIGGLALALTSVITTANLIAGPARVIRSAAAPPTPAAPSPTTIGATP